VGKHQNDWDLYHGALTYSYNNQIHYSTGVTPFELVLSRPPPHLAVQISKQNKNESINDSLADGVMGETSSYADCGDSFLGSAALLRKLVNGTRQTRTDRSSNNMLQTSLASASGCGPRLSQTHWRQNSPVHIRSSEQRIK
jgi:hypothetical protein